MCCNGWSRGLLTLYCFSFLFSQQPTPMPVFALLALVAYSVSLALIIPGLLQKNSSWRRMAILSATIALICHAFALEARIFPGGESGQNLSLLNVGSLVSLMICTVMTIVASRNRGWLLLPIVYAFALINPPSPLSCLTNISPTRKPPRGCWCISACRSSRTPR